MQAGFCCLEVGLTRKKNAAGVAIKNIIDFSISGLIFFLFGYSLMFGESFNGIIGFSKLIGPLEGKEYQFLFQLVFCSTAITIASGAVAERMKLHSYIILTIITSTLIYPIFGHWAWNSQGDGGWLNNLGFIDFAGSTVVHSLGSWVALATVIIIGPRIGRFDKNVNINSFSQNIPLAALGLFILWFGWIGFNGGSTLKFDLHTPKIIQNTLLGGMAGALFLILSQLLTNKKLNIGSTINGTLSGLVSITASCNMIEGKEAFLIGMIGAFISLKGEKYLIKKKIDDAVGAISVHGFAGAWGTLAVAIFGTYQNSFIHQISIQLLGVLVCFVFSFFVTFFLLKLIKKHYSLRVTSKEEHLGLNISDHGIFETAPHEPPIIDLQLEKKIPAKRSEAIDIKIYDETLHHEKVFYVIGIIFFLSLALGLTYTYNGTKKLEMDIIKKSMIMERDTIAEFRYLYSELVVKKAILSGMKINHNYKNKKNTIPLPATLSMVLSEKINKKHQNLKTRLFSKYPFPWRKNSNLSILDKDRRKVIEILKKNPTKHIYKKYLINGEEYIRLSSADIMLPSCVDCHNSHPQSPKTDWKVGDVRGVLEIEYKGSKNSKQIIKILKQPALLLLFFSFISLLTIIIFSKRFKSIIHRYGESLKISEEKTLQLEKQDLILQKALESKSLFITNISHEVRTPLNCVIGMSQVLNKTPLDKDQNNMVTNIQTSAEHLLVLINRILDYVKTDTYEESIDIKSFNLYNFILEIIEGFSPQLNKKKLFIDFEISPEISDFIETDQTLMRQVLLNIIGNAIKFTSKGYIKINIQKEKTDIEYLKFIIEDSGIGISKENQSKIWDHFFMADESSAKNFEGSGLGLPICKKIISRLQGKIHVQSELGVGSKFFFTIPLKKVT
jgi:ammonium transporter